jgi:hypothetical protein
MRTLIIAAAFLAATAAHAEPKHTAKTPAKAIAAKDAQVTAPDFQPKAFETKPLEIAAPDLEIKSKDVGESDLDRKLAQRTAKAAKAAEASMLREAPKAKADEATTADTTNATAKP